MLLSAQACVLLQPRWAGCCVIHERARMRACAHWTTSHAAHPHPCPEALRTPSLHPLPSPPLGPATQDLEAEAASAVALLVEADVVLTTYDVLRKVRHESPCL